MSKTCKNSKKNKINDKLTIDEYIEKFSSPRNSKDIKQYIVLLISTIGIIIASMLFVFVKNMFEINEILGYVAIGVSCLLFIILFVIPVAKIATNPQFITNVNKDNASHAKKHNKRVCEEIADKMIEISITSDGGSWYSENKIAPLAIARSRKDFGSLKSALTEIYNTDVKNAANKLIRDVAFQVGVTTSISQSEKVDTLIVSIAELNLIKKIVYLYGYRPNDAQMLKIYKSVLSNALLAYGIQSATTSIAGGIGKLIGGAAKEIPIISTVIGSVTDGTINGTLTAIIGFQTIKYLKREYKLQDILENIDVEESEEQQQALISDVKKEIVNNIKKKA